MIDTSKYANQNFRRTKMRTIFAVVFCMAIGAAGILRAQSPADSARITFRAHQPSTPTVYVPGQFNNWGNNSGGTIPAGDTSQMAYNGSLLAWTKTYTFKIHDASDSRRTLGDSVFQYKFNSGGTSSGWYSDPLNPEQNPAEYNNSVLRLTKFFWFEYLPTEVSQQITRITVGLVHANSDSIVSVTLSTGPTQVPPLAVTDITSSLNRTLRILDYTLPAPIARTDYVRLVATNIQGDSIVFARGGFTPPQMALPSYARHGVTLPSSASGDSTTFRIRVPGKQYVLLRVAPLGQSPQTADPIMMRYSAAGGDWWMNVKLASNTTYEYIYEFDDGNRVTDPYGRWNGTYGSRFSTGPAGLTADNYIWKSTAYQRPPLSKLVIYELHIGEFAGGYYGLPAGAGKFTHLATLMPYFDSLGVNALELMPVNDYGLVGASGFSWGYDINSYYALEPAYGDPAEFKALVDSAHSHGIAVILDVVFNHLNDTSPLWRMLPSEASSPYFKLCSDLRPNEDGYCFFKDMDHFTGETQELVFGALQMWIEKYRIDGFRYDYTQGIGWDVNQPAYGILGWSNLVRTIYGSSVYQIVEHLPESPALLYRSGITSGWHDSFRDLVFDEARSANILLAGIRDSVIGLGAFPSNDTPSTPSSYADRTEPVNMTVNHDEQSLIYEMVTYQGVPTDLAVQRDKLYGTLMFTSLGVPMLWQGVEMSEPRGWADGGQRLSYRPVQFSWLSTVRGQQHFAYYRALIRQRELNPALFRGKMSVLALYAAEKTMVWGFADTASSAKVMAVANFRAVPQTVRNVPWLAAGRWYNVFDQSILDVTGSTLDSLVIPEFTAFVFSTVPDTLLLPVTEHGPTIPKEFALDQNYPNPFNPTTTLRYRLPADSWVSVKVYDVLGREVATLVDERNGAGEYEVSFNASGLTSGVYFYRLSVHPLAEGRTGVVVQTKKMLLLR